MIKHKSRHEARDGLWFLWFIVQHCERNGNQQIVGPTHIWGKMVFKHVRTLFSFSYRKPKVWIKIWFYSSLFFATNVRFNFSQSYWNASSKTSNWTRLVQSGPINNKHSLISFLVCSVNWRSRVTPDPLSLHVSNSVQTRPMPKKHIPTLNHLILKPKPF